MQDLIYAYVDINVIVTFFDKGKKAVMEYLKVKRPNKTEHKPLANHFSFYELRIPLKVHWYKGALI